jgi:peptide chain release factor 1
MLDKLAEIEAKYEQMSAELSTQAVQADNAKFRSLSKAISEMQPLVDRFREYKAIAAEIADNEELLKDADMRELAAEELVRLGALRDAAIADLKVLLVPKDPNDAKNVIL